MTRLWNERRLTATELAEEMESHILEKADALETSGMPAEEALREARRSFGNKGLLQDRAHEVWEHPFFSRLTTSFRFAWLQLKREPLFVGISIFILSLGIGANTAIFAGLHQAILRKLPVSDPDSMVFVGLSNPKYPGRPSPLPYPVLSNLTARSRDIESVSGWLHDRVMGSDENDQQRSLSVMLITGNAFETLGIQPAAGRLLSANDAQDKHPNIWPVVLSYNFWTLKYHRAISAIGEHTTISGRQAEIVGVTPEGFEGITPNVPTQMYIPITFLTEQMSFEDDPLEDADFFAMTGLARLRKGVTMKNADLHLQQETASWLQKMLQPFAVRYRAVEGMSLHLSSASRGQQALDEYGSTLKLLQLFMVGALLFCCISVAGLQLARSLERTHEFAVRVALGANRGHLIQQCLIEAAILSSGGALLAIPIMIVITHMLSGFLTKPGAGEIVVIHPDWGVYAAAGGFAIICSLVIGMIPAIFARSTDPCAVLKAKSSMRRSPLIASRVLLAAQLAVTFLLIVTASFYWRTLHHIHEERLGYDPTHVTEISAQFQEIHKTSAEIIDLYDQMLRRLNRREEIESATMTWITQFTTFNPQINVAVPGDDMVRSVSFNQIGPLYFHTLKMKMLAGREFDEGDRDEGHCILNELTAKHILHVSPDAAIGSRIRVSFYNEINTVCKVVGVVASSKFADVHTAPPSMLFLPITPLSIGRGGYMNNMVFLVRGEHEDALEQAYTEVLAQVAPGTGYQRFLPMERQFNDALGKERLLYYATSFFGALALFLCTAAMLSLLLMRVRQSMPEIALRVALGATPLHAAAIVLREMILLMVAGTGAGFLALEMVEYMVTHLLHVQGPVAFSDVCGAAGLLFIMTFIAGAIPTLHAARLQPMPILCRDS